MGNTWFISDTHFRHRRIMEYSKRPFASIEEHDEILVLNWNSAVKKQDSVYFLGDLIFGEPEVARLFVRRLNGTILFIAGNHDRTASSIRNMFAWYGDVKMLKLSEQRIFMSHYAHRVWPSSHHGVFHCYGHSHNSLPDDPKALSMDVGIDATAARLAGLSSGQVHPLGSTKPADYRPISLDEVKAFMSQKTFVPVDHHGSNEQE